MPTMISSPTILTPKSRIFTTDQVDGANPIAQLRARLEKYPIRVSQTGPRI